MELFTVNHPSSIANRKFLRAFTIMELLTVIAILGIIAALAVPALKNFGKSDINISGSRQMLDDVARARQLAMSLRTTVYMVFIPPNFWQANVYNNSTAINNWKTFNGNLLMPAQWIQVTNLSAEQFTGYTFIAHGAVGDQPGQHQWHYLAPWQTLPDGAFIQTNKFAQPGSLISSTVAPLYSFWNQDYFHPPFSSVYAFSNLVAIPFPTATNNTLVFPCIAFNYLGQLTMGRDSVYGGNDNMLSQDEYIPLSQGSVLYAHDADKVLQLGPCEASENPPGNSTNISYNIIHIDRLTGRAVLEYHKIQ